MTQIVVTDFSRVTHALRRDGDWIIVGQAANQDVCPACEVLGVSEVITSRTLFLSDKPWRARERPWRVIWRQTDDSC